MKNLLRISFFLLLSLLALSSVSKISVAAPGIMVPYYIDLSNSASLNELISAHTSNPSVPMIVIVNLGNPGGPGTSSSPTSLSAIQQMQNSGITVVGYVDTDYGAISQSTEETEMQEWKSWYGVTGIFFDEMAASSGYETYYTTLTSYAKSTLGMSLTIGNPGGPTQSSYVHTVDIITIYESPGMPSTGSLNTFGDPASNFALIAYGVPSAPSASTLSSYSPYVSYLYVTDASGGNPYDVLPSYFSSEVAALNTGGATTTSTSSSSSSSTIATNPCTTCEDNCLAGCGSDIGCATNCGGGAGETCYAACSSGTTAPTTTIPTDPCTACEDNCLSGCGSNIGCATNCGGGPGETCYNACGTTTVPTTTIPTDSCTACEDNCLADCGSDLGCAASCGGSFGETCYVACGSTVTSIPTTTIPQGQSGTCVGGDPTSPCTFLDAVESSTTYDGAGGGTIVQLPPNTNPSPLPIISEVLQQNAQDAQFLLTCPNNPDASQTLEYLTSDLPGQTSYIMGDKCLAESAPLQTSVARQIVVSWSGYVPASSTASVAFDNLAIGAVSNLAYSGGSDTNGNRNYNLSNGYDSASYISGQVPASPQYGIWTWNAEYANLAAVNAGLSALQTPDALTNLQILDINQHQFSGNPLYCKSTLEYTSPCGATTTSTSSIGSTTTTSSTYGPCGEYSVSYIDPTTGEITCVSGHTTAPLPVRQYQPVNSVAPASVNASNLHTPKTMANVGDDSGGGDCVSDAVPDCGGNPYYVRSLVPTNYYWSCSYLYNYQVNAEVSNLGNTQIPVPVQTATLPQKPYLLMNNFPYGGFVEQSLPGSCSDLDLFHGTPCDDWTKISSSATLYLANGKKYGVNVYVDPADPSNYWTVYSTSWFGYIGFSLHTGFVPITSLTYKSVGALPYLLYNISMPAEIGAINNREEYLNLSYDIYSPHNYLDPANYLEPLPLSTDSGLFAAYKSGSATDLGIFPSNMLSLSNPYVAGLDEAVTSFLSSIINLPAGLSSLAIFGSNVRVGNYYTGVLANPIYLSAAPNDYIYALTSAEPCTFWILGCNQHIYLYTMRFIPAGDLNLTNNQPNALGPITCADSSTCPDAWNALWTSSSGYWANSLREQSQNLYVTNVYPISSTGSSFWASGNWQHDAANNNPSIAPTAVTTDYDDDLFMLGCDNGSCSNFKFAEMIPGAGGGNYIYDAGQTPAGFKATGELAADPDGQYVYVAGENYGNVLVYGTPPNSNFIYLSSVPLSFSNPAYNFNVVSYLASGGPFGNALIASAYSNIAGVNDVSSNHHPLAISEYDGFLYVLDNWTFKVPVNVNGALEEMSSAILLVRAFTENGMEVPIDGSSMNYLVPAFGGAVSTTTGVSVPQGGWAPYGWPISANIMVTPFAPDGGAVPTHISYCAAGCTYSPNTISTGYPPIGPAISEDGRIAESGKNADLGFSTDFNGTSYMIAHDYNWVDGVPGVSTCSSCSSSYTELLSFKLNLLNYTTLSYGANSPYTCYIGGNTVVYPSTPCTYDTTSNIVDIYAPILGVPSSFDYVESEGSPQQFTSITGLLTSSVPGGVDTSQYSGKATQQPITASCVDGTTGESTGTPLCARSSETPACASSTTLSCTSGGTPTCPSGAPTCTDVTTNIFCSNGDQGAVPTCADLSNPTCVSTGGSTNKPECADKSAPLCTPTDPNQPLGTAECSTQVQPLCPDGTTLPSCNTETDPSNAPQCNTGLQVQCPSGLSATPCASPGSAPTCLSLNTLPPPPGGTGVSAIMNTYVNSVITGYLLVPYHYTYQMWQQWSPDPIPTGSVYSSYSFNPGDDVMVNGALPGDDFSGTLCPPFTLPPPVPAPNAGVATLTDQANTIYTMNQVNMQSNYLQDDIQGGDTYLQLGELSQINQAYYTSNLSDAGTVMYPDLSYNIFTNRWYGEMFVNQTIGPQNFVPVVLAGAQVMNAVQTDNYWLEDYVQQEANGQTFPAYAAQDVLPLASPKIGADCGGTGCPANYYYDPLLSPLSSALTYANSMQPSIIPVFQLFAQSSYLYGLDLDLSLNPNIYGYNRLVYTFVDSFNNIITAPLDADLANIATVTASVQTTTNPLNANETNVIVSGTAMYTLPSGMQPLPAGSPIYLYYDTNINFYNSIVSPADSDPTNYYQYSLQCAFSTSLQACQLANPLSTLTQPAGATNPKTFGPIEANVITFQTQYDYNAVDYRAGNPLAGTTVPQCAATPSSLLDLPACLLNRAKCECNINGDYGLDPIRSDPYNAKLDEYCEPVYDDGNGIFTSQIGLVAIANTLPDGTFNAVFDTCGSGTPSIVAQYYGYPPPEPLPVFQPSLPYSANAFLFEVPPSGFVTSNEFNYAYSPASQSASFNIGSYALPFGDVDPAALMLAALALLIISYAKRATQKPSGKAQTDDVNKD